MTEPNPANVPSAETLTEAKKKPRNRKKKRKEGYLPKSNALCIVVHDLYGKSISDKLANEILDLVNEKSLSEGLILSYTRT